jgi:hypothetical protein
MVYEFPSEFGYVILTLVMGKSTIACISTVSSRRFSYDSSSLRCVIRVGSDTIDRF